MTTSTGHRNRPERRSGATNGVWPMVKRWWPLGPFVLAGLLVALAAALDTGDSGRRDAALLIGSFALYVLLPLATLIAVTVLIVRHRMRAGLWR